MMAYTASNSTIHGIGRKPSLNHPHQSAWLVRRATTSNPYLLTNPAIVLATALH